MALGHAMKCGSLNLLEPSGSVMELLYLFLYIYERTLFHRSGFYNFHESPIFKKKYVHPCVYVCVYIYIYMYMYK
jgi:hypothetical protein